MHENHLLPYGYGLAGEGAAWYNRATMQEIPTLLGFTAGELSPWLTTRYDLQAYQRGAALLKNVITMPYGGVRRRKGTCVVARLGVQTEGVRLFPFVYSAGDAAMLLFTPGWLAVYKGRECLCRLSLPWGAGEQLAQLRFMQLNDTVYCTGPATPPVLLYRVADDDWRWEEIAPEPYPRETYARQQDALQVQMNEDDTACLSFDAATTTARFDWPMIGKELVLAEADVPPHVYFEGRSFAPSVIALPDLEKRTAEKGKCYSLADGSSNLTKYFTCIRPYTPALYNGSKNPEAYPDCFIPGIMWAEPSSGRPYEVCGDWTLRTTGSWNASWELWRSYDTFEDEPDFSLWEWTCVKSFQQSGYGARENWALSGTESRPCRMILVCRRADSLPLSPMLHFEIGKGRREYKFLITDMTDECHALAQVCTHYCDNRLNFSTRRWSFGAFGSRNGYPAFTSFFQGRLWYGGMPGLPTTLLGSVVDDFDDFHVGSSDDDALHLTLASDNQSSICWLCPARGLLVGTTAGEWMLGSGDGAAVTARSAAFSRQSAVGGECQPAVAVENTALFVQRGGRRLREISYKLESDGFTATDTSILAEHLLQAGIREFSVQHASDTYIWVLLRDGTVAVLTLNAEQQISAWQRMEFADRTVLCLACLPDTAGGEDEVWLVLQDAAGKVTVERICAQSSYLDSMVSMGLDPQQTVTSLSLPDFAGHTVGIIRTDVSPHAMYEVVVSPSGQATLPVDMRGFSVELGYPIESVVQTMPLEGLNSFNAVRQLSRLRVRLLNSDPQFEYKASPAERWEKSEPQREHIGYPFTGSLRLLQMPDAAVGQGLCLRYNGPYDFCLQALTIESDYHGK